MNYITEYNNLISHESSLKLPRKKKNAVAMLRAMGRREFERARDTNLHLA